MQYIFSHFYTFMKSNKMTENDSLLKKYVHGYARNRLSFIKKYKSVLSLYKNSEKTRQFGNLNGVAIESLPLIL